MDVDSVRPSGVDNMMKERLSIQSRASVVVVVVFMKHHERLSRTTMARSGLTAELGSVASVLGASWLWRPSEMSIGPSIPSLHMERWQCGAFNQSSSSGCEVPS